MTDDEIVAELLEEERLAREEELWKNLEEDDDELLPDFE